MPCEIWRTLAATGCHRERPFAAELFLYDKLVIPLPP